MEAKKIYMSSPSKECCKKLRVAAYCRVSTDTDDQQNSFEGQVKHYTEMIEANPEWDMAGIYADDGITGTSAEKRPAFMRMIKDCEENKIDIILTKSISRFARNTLECLTYVRQLNQIGVHLLFEINNIDTRETYSEMLLTVLAAFAQEESRSISENTSWGIRKRFQEGTTRWCKLYGYKKTEEGDHQIVPEEALVVRKVFDLYEHGESIARIRNILAEDGIKSPKGKEKWSNSAVYTLLDNERYAGDIVLQKYYTENHLTHKAVKNDRTKVPSYFVENHHAPIVTRKQYDRCQKIMKMRKAESGAEKENPEKCNQYPLGDKLRCPYCGCALYQRFVPVLSKRGTGWCCELGKEACRSFIIRSNLVEAALLEAYKKVDVDLVAKILKNPDSQEAATLMLKIKGENPEMQRVDYWWVDDLIDQIAFGKHSKKEIELSRLRAMEEQVEDDRTMKVYWKCGLVTTVLSGVTADCEHPALVAELYNRYKERRSRP